MKDGDLIYDSNHNILGVCINGKVEQVGHGAEHRRAWDWLVNLGKEIEKSLKKGAKA